MTKDDLKKVEYRLDKVEGSIEELKTEVIYVKNDVRDLKAERITTLEKAVFPAN